MKENNNIIILIAMSIWIIIINISYSQPAVDWDYFINETSPPYIGPMITSEGFISTNDRGYIIVGHKSLDIIVNDFLLEHGIMLKIDERGEYVWETAFGDSITYGSLIGCYEMRNNSYVSFGGTGFAQSLGGNEVYEPDCTEFGLINVDIYSDAVWENNYSYASNENNYPVFVVKSVINMADNYSIFGTFSPGREYRKVIFLLEINSSGDSISTLFFDFDIHEDNLISFDKIVSTADNCYIIVGEHTFRHVQTYIDSSRFITAKIDGQGDIYWISEYPGEDIEKFASIIEVENSEYVLSGWQYYYNVDHQRIYPGICILMKINDQGDLIWRREYNSESLEIMGNTPFFGQILFDNDGNYVVVGHIWANDSDSYDVFLVKFDTNGNVLWSRTYNNYFRERSLRDTWPYYLVPAHGGGYAVLCSSILPGIYGGLWLFKTEPDYVSVPDVRLPLPAAGVSVYPNPFSDFLNVQLPQLSGAQLNIRLFDLQGRVIYSLNNLSRGLHNSGGFIDLQNLNSIPSGAYFLDLRDQNNLIGRIQIWKVK